MRKKILKTLTLLFALSFLGCASLQKDKTLSAEDLYKQGVHEFNKKNYIKAEEIFKNILNEFPNSKGRSLALMALASTYFRKEEYEEAKFQFERFIEQYPANKEIVKAYYLKAMCSFNQMESHQRDQSNAHLALEGFEKVIKTFQKGEYVTLAKQKKEVCRKQLAMNLLYIGKYYFGIGAYQPVIVRMNELLENYPKQKFLDEAIFLLGESYYREDNKEKAFISFNKLIREYPNSKYKSDARDRLSAMKQ